MVAKSVIAIQKLNHMQKRLQKLENRLLATGQTSLHKLASSCQLLNMKVTIFNNGLIKLVDLLKNYSSNDINFVQELANFIPREESKPSLYPVPRPKGRLDQAVQNFKLPLLDINSYITYNNNQLEIIIDDKVLILDADYALNSKVLVKQLPNMKDLGYFIVGSATKLKFQEDYLLALDKLFNMNDLTILNLNPVVLSELFHIKTQQFHLSIGNLAKILESKVLGSMTDNNLDIASEYKGLVAEVLELFILIFKQMREALLDYANNASIIQ